MLHPTCLHRSLWPAVAVAALVGCGRGDRDTTPRVDLDAKWVKHMRDGAASSAAGTGAVAKKGEGWGTLQGTIHLVGAPSERKPPAIDKDQDYCGKKEPLVNESVTVGPNLSLANVVVFLRTKTDVHESYAAKEKTDVPLDNHNCRFEPHVTVMRVSQKLAVKNSDPKLHNTRVESTFGNAENKNVQPGTVELFTMQVPEPSPVPISCSVHTWMRSYVLVKDNPYAAVTDKSGTFTIANLPAGIELEFQIWHEAAPNGLGGKSDQIPVDGRGRFKVTIPKDQTLSFEMAATLE